MGEKQGGPQEIQIRGARVHNLKNVDVNVPLHKIVGIAGVSGSGKSSLALGVLYAEGSRRYLEALSTYTRRRMTQAAKADVDQVLYVPAALALHQRPGVPGIRSTFGTGTELLNSLRLMFSRLASHRCPNGHAVPPTLAVAAEQAITCPECRGSRYGKEAGRIKHRGKNGLGYSLPQLMAMDIHTALKACQELKLVRQRLQVLEDLGLGYLTLGEATPALSGGEAQRLKLASEMGRGQEDTVFVFDEPTIGLHPLDVRTLLQVFETLIRQGATVVVIEHDLDVIRNADYIIDMGPGGGEEGGRIVAQGTPEQIAGCGESLTGRYLR